jgi:hypothetical protein
MKLTAEKREAGLLSESNLDLAARVILDQGFVVLDGVLPTEWVHGMRDAVGDELAAKYEREPEALARTHGHGGIQSPFRMPFIDPLIIENPIVFQILDRLFGEYFFGCLPYGCNTAFPDSGTQNVHRDCGHLFPELQVALPPVLVVVNIALDDFTPENGATEIWPGSHHALDTTAQEIDYLRVESERPTHYPSVRTEMPAGSIVVRDMRTWHRGMPNTTNLPRTMLSLVYYRRYFLPDDLGTVPADLSDAAWELLSERAKAVYRLRR